jgi:signal transduction histidine kinase
MRVLVGGLVELARGRDDKRELEEVRLDEIAEECVERARARFPGLTFDARLEPSVVQGLTDRLDRAVWNLLENAGKWSENGRPVDITVQGGELTVRDHGPGISAEDKPHVFDRFYRATSARGMPGSGLGLAIVRDVATEHGGEVEVDDAPGGGTIVRLKLRSTGENLEG